MATTFAACPVCGLAVKTRSGETLKQCDPCMRFEGENISRGAIAGKDKLKRGIKEDKYK